MDNLQKIIFIPNQRWSHPENRGSSLMRAYIISEFLKKSINSVCSRNLPNNVNEKDIVIFVKDTRHRDINSSKLKGCITVCDPIDDVTSKISNVFDIVIACSEVHANIISINNKIDRKKIIVIDHFHTNTNRFKSIHKEKNDKLIVGTVSYSKTAMMNQSDYIDFLKFSDNNNFDFKNIDITKFKLNMSSICDVQNFDSHYKNIHIGLSLHDPKVYRYHLNQKPTTSITSYASYDIPVICTYQHSMDKILLKFPTFSEFIVDNIEDSKSIILKLMNNYEYYEKSRLLFHDIGEMFHMDNAKEKYIDLINKTYENNL